MSTISTTAGTIVLVSITEAICRSRSSGTGTTPTFGSMVANG